MANLNLTQILALLQNNLLQNQGNNGSQALEMSDTGTDFLVSKKVVDPTTFASNSKCDDAQEDDDELLRDMTQEFQCEEERGPPIHDKLQKILQDLIWGVFKKREI